MSNTRQRNDRRQTTTGSQGPGDQHDYLKSATANPRSAVRNRRAPLLLLLIIILILLSACGFGSAEPEESLPVVPTVHIATSATLPAITLTPVERIVVTPSGTSEEIVATTTRLAPTATASSSGQPAATLTPLPAPGDPTSTPPEGGPQILFFEADADVIDPGQPIRLSWSTAEAITITLWKLAPTGQLSDFWDVEPAGEFIYQTDIREHNLTKFALFVGDAAGNSQMATVSVTLRCLDPWFFDGAPEVCPWTAAIESQAAEQHFEGGLMIWIAEEDRIYVLFDDTIPISWNAYPDTWGPDEPDRDPDLLPPAGLFQPVRGFGKVWREHPEVNQRLGWAVDEEQGFTTIVQSTSYAKYNEIYLRALDGNIYWLKAERSGWEQIEG